MNYQILIAPLIALSISSIFITSLVFFFGNYSCHRTMTKKYSEKWKKSSFKECMHMVRRMKPEDWEYDKYNKKSLFYGSNVIYYKIYIHASIIRFRNVGYVLSPVGYILFLIWKNNETKLMRAIN